MVACTSGSTRSIGGVEPSRAQTRASGVPGTDVVAPRGPEHDDQVQLGGQARERSGVDGLHVPGPLHAHDRRPGRRLGQRPDHLLRAEGLEVPGGDRLEGSALGLRHDVVHLDRVRDVVDEVDERADAREGQDQRHGDRELRHEGLSGVLPATDRVQPGERVGERAHEDRQDGLVAPVPQEVAQEPGRVLGRGDLEGDDREREHRPGDRDHRGRDHDQELPRLRRAAPEGPAGEERAGFELHARERRPDEEGDRHRGSRQEPQGALERVAEGSPPDALHRTSQTVQVSRRRDGEPRAGVAQAGCAARDAVTRARTSRATRGRSRGRPRAPRPRSRRPSSPARRSRGAPSA